MTGSPNAIDPGPSSSLQSSSDSLKTGASQKAPYHHLSLQTSKLDHKLIKSPILRGDEWPVDSQVTNSPTEIINIIHDTEARRFRLGIILIIIAVASWMIGLELVNAVLKDDTYQKPFLFAYIIGSFFTLNLIPDVVIYFDPHKTFKSQEKTTTFDNNPIIPLTKKEILVLSFQLAIIYYLYNAAALTGLKYTSASNQTVLASTTSIFTLFIGSFLNIDSFTIKKTACTVVSFVGVLLVSFSESKSQTGIDNNDGNKFVPKNPLLGNSLAIFQALLYAIYLIVMKVKCGTGNKATNERRLFGLVGVITMVFGIPLLYTLDYFGIESFEFPPPSTTILILVLINGLFSYISDFTTVLSLLLTSPLITSLSLTSSIPITIFIDYLILFFSRSNNLTTPHSNKSNFILYVMGIISILLSVILINLNSTAENELIEQVIDQAIDEAVRDDEVLSPVLSPMLNSRPHSNFGSPLLMIRRTPSKNKVSNLSLEGSQLINKNHSSKLYTVNQDQSDRDLDIDQIETGSNFMVYGGNNHIYHVKHIDNHTLAQDSSEYHYVE